MKFLDYIEKSSNIKNLSENQDLNIAILRSYTCENIDPILKTELFNKGFNVNIDYGIFNQFYQEILDEQSFIYQKNIDIIIILIRPQDLFAKIFESTTTPKLETYSIENMINNIKQKSNAKAVIILNLEEYEQEINGILEYNDLNSVTTQIKKFNLDLISLKEKYNNIFLVDINKIIQNIGAKNTYNDKMKYISKDPYKPYFYIELSKYITRIIDRIYNHNKKVLLVDLDNTLYKGILGEDDIKKITNFEEYPNAHYKNLQIKIKNLIKRGILVCLVSKNNYSDVEDLFNTNKMYLKLKDFTLIKANWEDKYKNIIQISKELNLGLDSFVFIDDNKYEIEMVNKMIPEVETINISSKPEEAEKVLDDVFFFDTLKITEEDIKRAQNYQNNVISNTVKEENLEEFLKNLQMKVEFKILNKEDKELIYRASQMTLKTNQFNMTTKRYTVEELEQIVNEKNSTIVMMFVEDKFGDNGSTGLFILKNNIIDTFLLSCRVLKRNLEFTMLDFAKYIIKQKFNSKEMIAEFIPTPKNQAFSNFYEKAGMTKLNENTYKIDTNENICKIADYIEIKNNNIYKISRNIDKIRNLNLVKTHEKFNLMNKKQLKEISEKIVSEIEKSNIKRIVVSESGATPLINICSKIAEEKNLDYKWFYFKTPRQNEINLYEMIKFYLSDEELRKSININNKEKSRDEFLKEHCEKIDLNKYLPIEKINVENVFNNINKEIDNLESLDDILRGTTLYYIFSNQFIFFDEYILSGTVLRNFNFYAKLICKDANYKIGAYMIFTKNIEKYKQIQFSIYSEETEIEAYKNGVYPFEDRIDIIGYFYYIDKDNYKKINVKDLANEYDENENEIEKFIDKIYKFIEEYDILNLIKQKCKKEDLKEYFNKEDIVRYILKCLEENISIKSIDANFIKELFELYSPIWIPMPKEYHYEYWKTFVRIQSKIDEFVNENLEKYKTLRKSFISKLAKSIS